MITAEEFINKHLGKTYKNIWDEEVMIVGISDEDIIIGNYNNDGWADVSYWNKIKIFSPIIKSYNYLYVYELDDIDKLLSA